MSMKKKIVFCIVILVSFLIFGNSGEVVAQYELLESIPGGETEGSEVEFSTYIQGIYNFAVGFVVIAALLMITIGGFYYILSAGNQAQAGTAKKIVTDALLGLVVVFIAWLILYTINPDLVGADPSVANLSQNATTPQSNAANPQSTQHSDQRVSQQATQPQTYCNSDQCFNSFAECSSAGGGECRSAQTRFSDPMNYYSDDGNGNFTQYADLDSCEDAGGNCLSGSEMKARMLNNVKTNEEMVQEAEDAGLTISDNAKKNLNKMTKKTFETAKELGGTVAEVGISGTTYKAEGAETPSLNGTRNASESMTIKNLKDLASKNTNHVKFTQDEESSPGTVYHKYEFSADHPDPDLAGTTAVYNVKNIRTSRGNAKKYSQVTVTAAQGIAKCRAGGC
jgi:hypothetical protein